jgi:hypothetical protein
MRTLSALSGATERWTSGALVVFLAVVCVLKYNQHNIIIMENGEIRSREQVDGDVATALLADLEGEGHLQLIIICRNGQGSTPPLNIILNILFVGLQLSARI